MESEKEKEGQHPRSIAQIRRANKPKDESSGSDRNDTGDQLSYIQEQGRRPRPTSLDSLCSSFESSSDINVICSWTSSIDKNVVGRHHLRQLAVRPEFQCKGCPVLISSKHDTSFVHDFSSGPLVSVELCRQSFLFI